MSCGCFIKQVRHQEFVQVFDDMTRNLHAAEVAGGQEVTVTSTWRKRCSPELRKMHNFPFPAIAILFYFLIHLQIICTFGHIDPMP